MLGHSPERVWGCHPRKIQWNQSCFLVYFISNFNYHNLFLNFVDRQFLPQKIVKNPTCILVNFISYLTLLFSERRSAGCHIQEICQNLSCILMYFCRLSSNICFELQESRVFTPERTYISQNPSCNLSIISHNFGRKSREINLQNVQNHSYILVEFIGYLPLLVLEHQGSRVLA